MSQSLTSQNNAVAVEVQQQSNSEVQLFENSQFGKVRVIMKDGDPWFVAKDVCECLDIQNPTMSLRSLDSDEKADLSIIEISSNGTEQARNVNIISESGLYSLVLRSRKPEAKVFKRWVTHEVLPSIRKTGGYSTSNENHQILQAIETLALQNQELNNKIDALGSQIQEMVPKAKFYDTVTQSDQTYDMGDAAKVLGKCGRNTLFKTLKQKNVLMSNRSPYQRYVDNGMFKVAIDKNSLYSKTVVTGKGLQHIKKILDEE